MLSTIGISVEYDRSVPTKSSQQRWQASALVSVPCSSSGRVLANPQEELDPVDHCVGSTLFATPKSTMLTMLWSFRMASRLAPGEGYRCIPWAAHDLGPSLPSNWRGPWISGPSAASPPCSSMPFWCSKCPERRATIWIHMGHQEESSPIGGE